MRKTILFNQTWLPRAGVILAAVGGHAIFKHPVALGDAPHWHALASSFPQSLLLGLLLGLIAIAAADLVAQRLGIPKSASYLLAVVLLVGCHVNIPLGQLTVELPQKPVHYDYFTIMQPAREVSTVIALNVSGALIPAAIALALLLKSPKVPTLLTVGGVAIATYATTTVEPGRFILINPLVPVVIAAALSLLLAPRSSLVAAYIGGTIGALLGGDILHLSAALPGEAHGLAIGGRGLLDAVIIVGCAAPLLAWIAVQGVRLLRRSASVVRLLSEPRLSLATRVARVWSVEEREAVR